MKIREITNVFKLFEVGEPEGSPEAPFGSGEKSPTETENGLDLDSMMPGGGQGGEEQNNDQRQPPPGGAVPSENPMDDPDPDGEEEHHVSSKLIDFAKNHPFFADHGSDEHDDDPSQLLGMGKDQLKQEANNVRTKMASITMKTDAGLYADSDYQYLQDKLGFLKDLIKRVDK